MRSHAAVIGDIEVPVTWWKHEAVGLMQEAGIVGAGGAGFPTYVKYESGAHALLVNAAESEPGYYADKLLLRDQPEALVNVFGWLKKTFSFDVMFLAAEDVARPYMRDFEELASRLRSFSIAYVEPLYKYGQERALVKAVLGIGVGPKENPLDHGIVVNNNETLFNVYRAAFLDEPVCTKLLHVYGEVGPPRVFEVPIGTLACDLLRIYGADPARYAECILYDGGPLLAESVGEPMGEEPAAPVRRTTNAFLVVHPEKDAQRRGHYPDPNYTHNSIDAPWAPTRIENVEERVHRVRVPLAGKFWKAGPLAVHVGDRVEREDTLAAPLSSERSVAVHASITGKVTAVTDEFVEIARTR